MAIITPMTLMPNQHIDFSLSNPWLLGALAAFVVGVWRQHQLLVILVVSGFSLWRSTYFLYKKREKGGKDFLLNILCKPNYYILMGQSNNIVRPTLIGTYIKHVRNV
ncbi:AzlD domain-containing protein [Marinomonas hwangdonensis]|uniref:AzlD domain-containing protein n=1 Tax=Marinomonas hwangdonensis TaxID=1053647 RepID=UPI001F4D8013|nr:AzlD domain-containing protein [Marinomonas hwangdonensis]